MYTAHWEVLLEPPYVAILLGGIRVTLLLALFSTLASLVLGTVLACGRASPHVSCSRSCAAFCTLVRSLPGVFWLILLFFCLPVLLPRDAGLLLNAWDAFPFWAAAAGLSLNNAPYVADILFSMLNTAGCPALMAARLSGFSRKDYWMRIALPSAFLTAMPALSARLLHNFRNTSLAMVISVPELTWATQEVESLSFAGLEVTTAATVIYCGLSAMLSLLLWAVERFLARLFHQSD